MTARSYLYVPADQPDKLERADSRGADALIIDLEDAVASVNKRAARALLGGWLDRRRPAGGDRDTEIWVRINRADERGDPPGADLDVAVHPAVAGLVLPKCESPSALERLDQAVSRREAAVDIRDGHTRVAALIETAGGLLRMEALAASRRVARLQIGEADLIAALGMSPGSDRHELLPLRLALVVHSAAAGIEPPAGPVHTDLNDLDGLARSSRALARLGFAGRGAIHPTQIPVINDAFTPSSVEVAAAADVIERFEEALRSGSGVAETADGLFIDEAVVRSARAVMGLARLYSQEAD